MKRVILVIITIILLTWGSYVGAEYFRCYAPEETNAKLLIQLKTKETDTYERQTGLGFSVTKYKVSVSDAKEGTIVKEFRIFGIRVSKTTLVRETNN